jgi:16S rRNA (cytidine1402-2'-O)-methyltransferase
MTQTTGTLYLIPVPLGPEDDPMRVLPRATVEAMTALDYFVAENARSARAVLGRLPMQRPIQQIEIRELNQRTASMPLDELLVPLLAGRDCGLVSEAGCPAVADPGAALVARAHRAGVRVVPLIGPSALLLALMASGMNGQAFSFTGYVPVEPAQRSARLKALEARSAENAETVLMIETPYRNQVLFDEMLRTLRPDTTVTVCAELTLPGEQVRSRTVAEWRAMPATLERAPTVFALQAAPRTVRPERVSEDVRARRRR